MPVLMFVNTSARAMSTTVRLDASTRHNPNSQTPFPSEGKGVCEFGLCLVEASRRTVVDIARALVFTNMSTGIFEGICSQAQPTCPPNQEAGLEVDLEFKGGDGLANDSK